MSPGVAQPRERSQPSGSGDTLLFYGELNSNDKPKLGLALGSLTYTLPPADAVTFTTALGESRRNLIELPGPDFSNEQFQALGQLEWVYPEKPQPALECLPEPERHNQHPRQPANLADQGFAVAMAPDGHSAAV